MNIQQAKEEIIRTVHAYTKKGEDNTPLIPVEKQRPVLMIGPPGIGKTAIIKQIAKQEGIGLLSYTMTHHTRQSAIGLPVIRKKNYQGREYDITEYTMSEMVADIYELMEKGKSQTGILFLDEINCVSETLAPVILNLLQNKTFGTHKIPEGWIIVAAGNPPEYNKAVRELDMATLDRVRRIDIEANLSVWQSYASANGIHPVISSYLSVHPEHFYVIEQSGLGQLFATARGWEDLSCMLFAYEIDGETILEDMILEYLQHDEIARDFYMYYSLFYPVAVKINASSSAALSNKEWTDWMGSLSLPQQMAAASVLSWKAMTNIEKWYEVRKLSDIVKEELTINDITNIPKRITQRKKALEIKKEYMQMDIKDQLEEECVIRILEDESIAWNNAENSAKKDFVQQYLIQKDEEIAKIEKELKHTLEQNDRILEAADENSRLYYIADLTKSDKYRTFMAKYNSKQA